TTDILAQRFDTGELFLPHLVLAGEAMTEAGRVLEPALPAGSLESMKVVVIGTVEGDLHSVGKNIVAMMLRTGGFDVHDLGVDVRSGTFVQRAMDLNADIIALSCLMTTTLPYQREVIEDLDSRGLRGRFHVMVGGGPVTREWADEIGADGFGRDAGEALSEARRLVAARAQRPNAAHRGQGGRAC
ncbi:MAG: cobalamin-dependent protein, partial [Gemmatimonadetes bacterium]|nr:cobalamin-dependent protein [Gemmatimonadota bacterium]